jgi:hypothetical protein
MIHEDRVPAGRLVFNLDLCKIFVFMGGAANRNPRNSTTDKRNRQNILVIASKSPSALRFKFIFF